MTRTRASVASQHLRSDPEAFLQLLPHLDPAIAVDYFLEQTPAQQERLFRLLPIASAAQLTGMLPYHDAYILLQSRTDQDLGAILAGMDPGESARLLEEMPQQMLHGILDRVNFLPAPGEVQTKNTAAGVIVEARGMEKSFAMPDRGRIQVIAPTNLCVEPDLIIAVLGPSGSGKSTLLRMLSGLAKPTSGDVLWHGKPITSANPSIAIVFQSFALFPWLTVVENVEVPLLANGMRKEERRLKALENLEIVGLKGFANAYPKELSGGMKQRVGFARALAVDPELLFMDEPFSALDVLTAETLRGELLELWLAKKLTTKSIFLVTHNIEEAVSLADRVIVLGRNPGRIRADFRVKLPHPRARKTPEYVLYIDYIYKLLTKPDLPVAQNPNFGTERRAFQMLPHALRGAIAGLLEILDSHGGKDDVYQIAERLQMGADDLLPIVEASALLDFVKPERGDLELSDLGSLFSRADISERKTLFRNSCLKNVTLLQRIRRALAETENHTMSLEFFRDLLREHFSEEETAKQLETALNWGRYSDLFSYDADTDSLILEPDQVLREGVT